MNKTFVVGDIHGGLLALKQVLAKSEVEKSDSLIFLGDYVDGWSQSPEVLDYLIEIGKRQNCIFIRGNHDELLLQWLLGNERDFDKKMWFKHGGKATYDSYLNVSEEKKKVHIEFLSDLKNYHLDNQNRLFVHAGFTNMNGIEFEYFSKLFYWDRTLWETALALDENLSPNDVCYPKRLKLYKEIYIGHTPVTRIERKTPVNKGCIWNVDTGAAFKGLLTIMNIDTKEFWQSDALNELYPNEKGRN